MSDVYQYWRAAVAGQPEHELAQLRLPTFDGMANGEAPQPGLWRVRLRKGEPQVLMQIWLTADGSHASEWREGLKLAGIIDGKAASPNMIAERWIFAKPCTKNDGTYWREHGRWPSDPPPLAPRTHNQPEDPYDALRAEADDRLEQVQHWLTVNGPIGDQVTCDMARNMEASLQEMRKRADTMHVAEKAPHLKACRDTDDRYRFREALADWAGRLRTVYGQYMATEERRQREEAERKYREERARIEAERAKLREDDPIAALTSPEPELPPPPAPVKVQAGGGTGRKAGLKTDWDVEIVDHKLAALQVLDDPDVSAAVSKAIKRRVKAAKGKVEIPGVKITEVRRAA